MKNIFTIFASPEVTFKRVRESKTAWLLPAAVLLILSLLLIYIEMPIIEKTLHTSLQNPQYDSATKATILQTGKVMAYFMPLITYAITIFGGALLFMLLNLIVRGEAKYMQLVTVTTYSALPGIVGGLLTAIMSVAMDVEKATDVTISLAAFVSDKSSQLYHFLSILNPFTIWSLFLYVIGCSVMMRRPRRAVAAWIVGVWIVFSFGSLIF